jgi:hypothetical protein
LDLRSEWRKKRTEEEVSHVRSPLARWRNALVKRGRFFVHRVIDDIFNTDLYASLVPEANTHFAIIQMLEVIHLESSSSQALHPSAYFGSLYTIPNLRYKDLTVQITGNPDPAYAPTYATPFPCVFVRTGTPNHALQVDGTPLAGQAEVAALVAPVRP